METRKPLGMESCDKRGEQIIGDDGVGSTIIREAGAVQRMRKGLVGLVGVSGKLWKEIYSTEMVEEDGRG